MDDSIGSGMDFEKTTFTKIYKGLENVESDGHSRSEGT